MRYSFFLFLFFTVNINPMDASKLQLAVAQTDFDFFRHRMIELFPKHISPELHAKVIIAVVSCKAKLSEKEAIKRIKFLKNSLALNPDCIYTHEKKSCSLLAIFAHGAIETGNFSPMRVLLESGANPRFKSTDEPIDCVEDALDCLKNDPKKWPHAQQVYDVLLAYLK